MDKKIKKCDIEKMSSEDLALYGAAIILSHLNSNLENDIDSNNQVESEEKEKSD